MSPTVRWRPVLGGLLLQLLVAVFVLKTRFGFCFFDYLGGQVETFLGYTNAGISFVFTLEPPFIFAFRILPIVVFFSSFVAMLYHTGLMLYLIKKVAWIMAVVMGTTAAESLVAVANIFVSQRWARVRKLVGKEGLSGEIFVKESSSIDCFLHSFSG